MIALGWLFKFFFLLILNGWTFSECISYTEDVPEEDVYATSPWRKITTNNSLQICPEKHYKESNNKKKKKSYPWADLLLSLKLKGLADEQIGIIFHQSQQYHAKGTNRKDEIKKEINKKYFLFENVYNKDRIKKPCETQMLTEWVEESQWLWSKSFSLFRL